MRKKLISTAVLGLALIFTSTAFAQTTFTQLDRFESWSNYGITKSDSWYNNVVPDKTPGIISNLSDASEEGSKRFLGKDGDENFAELRDIKTTNVGDTKQVAALGMDLRNNKGNSTINDGKSWKYDLSECTGGFKYKYKGHGHSIHFQVPASNYPTSWESDQQQWDDEWEYLKNFCNVTKAIEDVSDWTEVEISASDFKRCDDRYNNWGWGSADATTLEMDKVIQFQWKVGGAPKSPGESAYTFDPVNNGNLKIKDLQCIGANIFMEPEPDIHGVYGKKLSEIGDLTDLTGAEGFAWTNANTVLKWTGEPTSKTLKNGTFYYIDVPATYTHNGLAAVSGTITVYIDKAEAADFAPTDITTTYAPGLTLESVNLPAGWSWVTPTASVGDASTSSKTFKAKFEGTDFIKATPAGGIDVSVTISKATYAEYPYPQGVSYSATYDQTLSQVTPVLLTGWSWKEVAASTKVGDAGTRTYNVVFAGNANYNAVSGEGLPVTIHVAKATPTFPAGGTYAATFGQTLANVTLPAGWSWVQLGTTKVGNVGSQIHEAVFTETANYNTATGNVTVTVSKAAATALTAEAVTRKVSIAEGAPANYTYDLREIPLSETLGDAGTLSFSLGTYAAGSDGVLGAEPTIGVDGHTLSYSKGTAEAVNKTATLQIKIDSQNYNQVTATITFKTTNQAPVTIAGLTKVDEYTYAPATPRTGYTGTMVATATGYTGTPVFKYRKVSETEAQATTIAPTNAGTYIVFLTLAAADEDDFFVEWSHQFTIDKVPAPTLTTAQLAFTATYGQTLSQLSLTGLPSDKGTWTWTQPATTTTVGNVGVHDHGLTYTPTDAANYEAGSATAKITVTKAAGATIAAPTIDASKTTTSSITINAVTAPNGQSVEYAKNTTNSAPTDASAWQASTTFSGLTANTTYYIFARAAANENYNAGTPSSVQGKTNANSSGGGSSGGGNNNTPVNTPQIASSNLNPIVRAMSGIIELQNLPKNAKVDVFNMQGKRIYSSNSVNSQVLKVQASAGMYIIRVASGSQVKVMRVSMR